MLRSGFTASSGGPARRFLIKLSLLTLVNGVIGLGWLESSRLLVTFRGWTNAQTESVLLALPRGQHVPLVMLGTSHSRNFSRSGNHERMEDVIGVRIANLSRGSGNGVVAAQVNLQVFFDQGNSTDVVFYFIDAWALFSPVWNEENPAYFDDEPFQTNHFVRSVAAGVVGPDVLWRHINDKFSPRWLTMHPESPAGKSNTREVLSVDPELIQNRVDVLYQDGLDQNSFRRYARRVRQIVDLVERHGGQVVFILYPTLLGEEPGVAQWSSWLRDLRPTGNVAFFDHRFSVTDPALFEDLDHLNTAGTLAYARRHLKPIWDDLQPR